MIKFYIDDDIQPVNVGYQSRKIGIGSNLKCRTIYAVTFCILIQETLGMLMQSIILNQAIYIIKQIVLLHNPKEKWPINITMMPQEDIFWMNLLQFISLLLE